MQRLLLCLLVGVSAFSLTRRRLAIVELKEDPSCATSCDQGYSEDCEYPDETGEYTLGCDMRPTSSCDDFSACVSPPVSPYTVPPPPPESSDAATVGAVAIFFCVLGVALCACAVCAVVYARFGQGSREGYELWWWCSPCLWWLQGWKDDYAPASAADPTTGVAPDLSGLSLSQLDATGG